MLSAPLMPSCFGNDMSGSRSSRAHALGSGGWPPPNSSSCRRCPITRNPSWELEAADCAVTAASQRRSDPGDAPDALHNPRPDVEGKPVHLARFGTPPPICPRAGAESRGLENGCNSPKCPPASARLPGPPPGRELSRAYRRPGTPAHRTAPLSQIAGDCSRRIRSGVPTPASGTSRRVKPAAAHLVAHLPQRGFRRLHYARQFDADMFHSYIMIHFKVKLCPLPPNPPSRGRTSIWAWL